jgi:hypothetical protein
MLSGKLATKAMSLNGVPSQMERPTTLAWTLTHGAAACSSEFGQDNAAERFLAPASKRTYDAAVRTIVMSTPAPRAVNRIATRNLMAPNEEVERRAGAPSANKAVLSQSSIPSLAHRR